MGELWVETDPTFLESTQEQAKGTTSNLTRNLRQAQDIVPWLMLMIPMQETHSLSSDDQVQRLSDHLLGYSAVQTDLDTAATALMAFKRRYGPVEIVHTKGIEETLKFITPIKSFTTKFALIENGSWTLIFNDMMGQTGGVDAYAICRSSNCHAIAINQRQFHRELHYFRPEGVIRRVEVFFEGGRWIMQQDGELQEWEDAKWYKRNNISRKLTPDDVTSAFNRVTGHPPPAWGRFQSNSGIGLLRSTHEVRVPIVTYKTVNDVNLSFDSWNC